jgi:hypothetical protein
MGGTVSHTDRDSNEAILARHRATHRTVHPDVVAANQRAIGAYHVQLQAAVGHLQAVLNKARTHAEQQAADSAARDWLISIGSEPA